MFEIIKSWLSADRSRSQPASRPGRIRRVPDKSPHDTLFWAGFLAAAVACFVLAPWPVMASGTFIGLISGIAAAWAASKPEKSTDGRKRIRVIIRVGAWGVVGILSFLLVLNPLLYAVWLPHEILALPKSQAGR